MNELVGALICTALLLVSLQSSNAIELTFEQREDSEECFHEELQRNVTVTLEFQVIAGGSHDIDCSVTDPDHIYIYRRQKIHIDSVIFMSQKDGVYTVCFGNEFSTFSHKVVYMNLQVDRVPLAPGDEDHSTVLTQMEASLIVIKQALDVVEDLQRKHRLREARGWKEAKDLNWRITWFGLFETVLILAVSTGQVVIVKHFFVVNYLSTVNNVWRSTL